MALHPLTPTQAAEKMQEACAIKCIAKREVARYHLDWEEAAAFDKAAEAIRALDVKEILDAEDS